MNETEKRKWRRAIMLAILVNDLACIALGFGVAWGILS